MTAIGLGCSRFGSLVGGTDRRTAHALIDAAREIGVRHFDTADIYGQGDSERFLGTLLASMPDAVVTTKAGQRFPLSKRLFLKAKPILRPLMAMRGLAQAASTSRAGLLPHDWSERHLEAAIEGSLRRLRRDAVDNLLLHSPSAAVLREGEAMSRLTRIRDRGKARRIGASIDDAAAFEAALEDERIEVLQLPLEVLLAKPAQAQRADAGNVELVVRELFASGRYRNIDEAVAAVPPGVHVALVGTSNPAHLREAVAALRRNRSC